MPTFFPGIADCRWSITLFLYRVLEPEVLVVRVLHEDMDAPERLLD
jgi:toxin ParE1/3/4